MKSKQVLRVVAVYPGDVEAEVQQLQEAILDVNRTISWGKLSRLPCTVAGSTLRTFDGYGLRGKLPARPALAPNIRFLSIDSHI